MIIRFDGERWDATRPSCCNLQTADTGVVLGSIEGLWGAVRAAVASGAFRRRSNGADSRLPDVREVSRRTASPTRRKGTPRERPG